MKYEFIEYKQPRSAQSNIDERMLLASFLKHKEIFQIVLKLSDCFLHFVLHD